MSKKDKTNKSTKQRRPIVCDCGNIMEPVDHENDCDLWRSKNFCNGKWVWNCYRQCLTTKDVAIDDEVKWEKEHGIDTGEIMPDTPVCPNCDTDTTVSCAECSKSWDKCRGECSDHNDEWYCVFCSNIFTYSFFDLSDEAIAMALSEFEDEDGPVEPCSCQPQKQYCYQTCKVRKDFKTGEWERIVPASASYAGWTGTWAGSSKCRHYNKRVELPGGGTVYVSSMKNDRKDDDLVPDWGLYLDYGWHPTWRAEHINWPDYGLPKSMEAAAEAITWAYELMLKGWKVEIGCIGGHGRTGTALACFAVLAGVSAAESVKWVHENHCKEAVESKRQEWFPLWFEAYVNGTELPEPPPEPVYTSTHVSACSKSDHLVMWRANKKKCDKTTEKEPCKWWKEDVDEFKDGKFPPTASQNGNVTTYSKSHSKGNMCHCGGNWLKCPCRGSNVATCVQCQALLKNSGDDFIGTAATTAESKRMLPDAIEDLTARCVMPGCNYILAYGMLKCSKCGIEYTEKFWTNSRLHGWVPKSGASSKGFVFVSEQYGWIKTAVVEAFGGVEEMIVLAEKSGFDAAEWQKLDLAPAKPEKAVLESSESDTVLTVPESGTVEFTVIPGAADKAVEESLESNGYL